MPTSPTVLIVEDDTDLRRLLVLIFERAEFRVAQAGDGMEALELIGQQPVDAILTDLSMPRLDGCELVRALRSRQSSEKLPILVLTGLPSSDPLVHCVDGFGVPVLYKPTAFKELPLRVKELLKGD